MLFRPDTVFPGKLFEPERDVHYHRWIPDELVKQGFASVTACYHDIFPDRADGAEDSALRLFADETGTLPRISERYSVIGIWAWGLSRMLDYAESDPLLDARHAAVHGHSRLSKTSLWAGAIDQRFQRKRPVRYMSATFRTKADRKLIIYLEAGFQNGGNRESI